MAGWNLPQYRADQVLQWVYKRQITDLWQMTNLPKADRDVIQRHLRMVSGRVQNHQIATDGVQKLLIDFGNTGTGSIRKLETECVMIPTESRKTACVSSQIGCPVGCRFCASGIGGLDANLTTGQIIEQVWTLGTLPGAGRISHIVFMGMGEPLVNFEQVTRAVQNLMADWGMGISGRRITISTVGLPAQIRRLADLRLPVTLAISLHAPNDVLRQKLIPWADYVTVDQLIEVGRYYFERSGREVTIEYTLIGGVNDRPTHARELAMIVKKLRSNVNLIRYNEVTGLNYTRPRSADVHQFQQILRASGINSHIRASRGRDVAAACGQLRHEATTGTQPN